MRVCKQCKKSIDHKPIQNKFCNRSCGISYTNSMRIVSDKTKAKISKAVSIATRGKYKKNPASILELSSRTVTKVLKRMKVGCSNCGWNRTTCDIHHINGRNIKDCNNHMNLSLLCPNCHRMVHEGILTIKLKSLHESIPNNWIDFYHG